MSDLNYVIMVRNMKTNDIEEALAGKRFTYDDALDRCNRYNVLDNDYSYSMKPVPQDLTTLTVEQFAKLYDQNCVVRDLVANFIRENIVFDVEHRETDLTVISASIVRDHSTYPLGGTRIDDREFRRLL